MRRRGFTALGAFLIIFIFLFGVWHTTSSQRSAAPHIDTEALGSSWIEKGEKAEDKVVVIAKMSNEDTSWATNDLPE